MSPTSDDGSFIAGAAFWGVFLFGGLVVGGWGWVVGALLGCIVAFVVWVYVGNKAIDQGRAQRDQWASSGERQRAQLLQEAVSQNTASGATSGLCPDCQYTPVAPSCRVCPRCGCRVFIREVGVSRVEGPCSNCGAATSVYCEDCSGRGKTLLFLVKDHRTGHIYWDRAGFESRGS